MKNEENYKKIVRNLTEREWRSVVVFYLKDIKDLFESLVEAWEVQKKHYDEKTD